MEYLAFLGLAVFAVTLLRVLNRLEKIIDLLAGEDNFYDKDDNSVEGRAVPPPHKTDG